MTGVPLGLAALTVVLMAAGLVQMVRGTLRPRSGAALQGLGLLLVAALASTLNYVMASS